MLDNVTLPAELVGTGSREATALSPSQLQVLDLQQTVDHRPVTQELAPTRNSLDAVLVVVLTLIAAAAIGNPLSESTAGIYGPGSLLALAAAGVVVAVAAALLPARWAASSAVAAVLRAE